MSSLHEGRPTRTKRRLLLPSNVTASTCIDTADALIAAYLLSRSNPSFRAASSVAGPRHRPASVDDFVDVSATPGDDGAAGTHGHSDGNGSNGPGRITYLRLCDYTWTAKSLEGDVHSSWDLDPCIGRLDQLRRLDVRGCRSVPPELSRLNHLEFLFLDGCKGLVSLPSRDISTVKTVHISGSWNEPSLHQFVLWATRHLVNLQTLRCTHLEDPPVDPALLEGIRANSAVCHNLHTLDLKYCGLRQDALEGLLFDSLLPNADRYPHLEVLDLANNDIDSLRAIAARIACTPNSHSELEVATKMRAPLRLRQLILTRNPVLERTEECEEHSATITILKYFQELGCLGFPRCRGSSGNTCDGRGRKTLKFWHPEVEYWLRINRCGRILVEGRRVLGPARTDHSFTIDKEIAPTLWPRVLERAYQRANDGVFQEDFYAGQDEIPYTANRATGVFYLLRHMPDLVGQYY
jgi:hypothetical protein